MAVECRGSFAAAVIDHLASLLLLLLLLLKQLSPPAQ